MKHFAAQRRHRSGPTRPGEDDYSIVPGSAPAPPTDADLIHRLYAGETTVLGDLYDRHIGLVYGLALRLLTDAQEAEDLAQEIFLNLCRNRSYNPQRGSLSSYLATLTRSRAIDRLRSRSARQRLLARCQQQLREPAPTPVEQAARAEQRQQVRWALAQLPPQQRQVLELSYYNGLSQADIAQELNRPLGTIKTWARKGLLQLRTTLAESARGDHD